MMQRIRKLLTHPGFRAEPVHVLWRAAVWGACVLARRAPVFALTSGGEKIRVPPDMRYTSVMTYLMRDWTEPELRRLEQFLRPGDVFIDVGANIGVYALKGARIVGPAGRVVAVEPGRDAGRLLTENVALNGYRHIAIVPKALADQEGQATLHHIPLGDDPQAFSLLSGAGHEAGEQVEMTTLDRLVADLGLARIDCIKIDVEGAEHMVLGGGRASIGRWHPTVIFEINCPTGADSGTPPDAAWDILAGFGYRFSRLVDGKLRDLDRMPTEFCNIIARHPDRR